MSTDVAEEFSENVFTFRRPGADPAVNPTAAGVLLGIELRRLRGDRTQAKASKESGFSGSKLSRLERGEHPPKLPDVQRLLKIYRAGGQDVAVVEELARHAVQSDWLRGYRDVLSDWLERLIALEVAASQLITYESKIVPGLVQTEGYAYEVIHDDLPGHLRYQAERRVRLRMERQQRFFEIPPRSVFYIEESTLHRQVGSPRVMVDQLQRLIELTERPGFGVRIITLDHTFASSVSSLTQLQFDGSSLPELIYNEHHDGADYMTPTADERTPSGEPNKVSPMEVFKELLLRLMHIGTERQESLRLLRAAQQRFRAQL